MHKDLFYFFDVSFLRLDERFIEFSNNVSSGLGIDFAVTFTAPLYIAMGGFEFTALFLDQVFIVCSSLSVSR